MKHVDVMGLDKRCLRRVGVRSAVCEELPVVVETGWSGVCEMARDSDVM